MVYDVIKMRGKLRLYLYYVAFVLQMSTTVLPYYVDSRYVVDLLQYIVVSKDHWGSHRSLATIPGANNHSTAYVFEGSSRQVQVATEAVHSLQKLLRKHNEFTVLASVKQQENNTGSIITLSVDGQRYLEVESSGRRDEIRLHYYPYPPGRHGSHPHPHTQTFLYHLADDNWHQMALTIGTHYVKLFIDCQKIHETQITNLDLSEVANSENVRLWLGQRNENQAYFKGAIEYVKIVLYPEGHQVQCPYADIPCPTCTQYYQLESSVQELYKVIEELNKKLLETESRLSAVEKCECLASCQVNGTKYRDGESWKKDHCTTCTCRAGQVSCVPPVCPKPNCKHPVLKEGECCPTCLRHCYYSGKKYDHLEEYYPRECIKCTCRNGRMTCHREEQCPVLDCPPEQQVAVEGECCKFCKGLDYCGKGHDCHQNATCYNLDTKYTCQCNDGFKGDGKTCQDLDECQIEGGHNGHYCHSNTKCINTVGSYKCECLPGYVRENQFACRELDECQLGLHDCHPHADCINTEGSFACRCSPGYHGDGRTCEPSCPEPCLNGGTCVAPGLCSCRSGYVGDHCQEDVNECEEGLAKCHPNSDCINIPGQYYCKCKKGYHSDHYDNLNGLLCRDVNECGGWGGGHQCPAGTECINTPGGYECLCQEHSECSAACQVDGEFHANGTAWQMASEPCSECVCKDGEVRCSRKLCDCASGFSEPKCCPQCAPELQCHHQDLAITYYSGDTWIYQCQICECLNGEIDCWALECPPLSCAKVIHEDGDCCPRCVEEDPCRVPVDEGDDDDDDDDRMSLTSMVCFFDGKKYFSGDSWLVPWDSCSSCTCQAGQICCTYNETCSTVKRSQLEVADFLFDGSGVQTRSSQRILRHDDVSQRKTRQPMTYPEEAELWQLRHVAGSRLRDYHHHANEAPTDEDRSGGRPAPERTGSSSDNPGGALIQVPVTDRPQPAVGHGYHGDQSTAESIPSREVVNYDNNNRGWPAIEPAPASGSSASDRRTAEEIVSVARLKNPRMSNSELTRMGLSVRPPGLASPPDTPTNDVGSVSTVLSHARESRNNRRRASRRQGRRGLRKRRKRPRVSSYPRATSRERFESTARASYGDWLLLERELKTLGSRPQRGAQARDRREKSSGGRRRKNFDGGG